MFPDDGNKTRGEDGHFGVFGSRMGIKYAELESIRKYFKEKKNINIFFNDERPKRTSADKLPWIAWDPHLYFNFLNFS